MCHSEKARRQGRHAVQAVPLNRLLAESDVHHPDDVVGGTAGALAYLTWALNFREEEQQSQAQPPNDDENNDDATNPDTKTTKKKKTKDGLAVSAPARRTVTLEEVAALTRDNGLRFLSSVEPQSTY